MQLIQGSVFKKMVMVGLIAGSGVMASSAFAVETSSHHGHGGCESMHGEMNHAKMEAHRAEHLSALKLKLKLKPEQETAWRAFTTASQAGMRAMHEGKQAERDEFAKLTTPQRLDKKLTKMDERRAQFAERVKAVKTFYAQLTPEQQSVFDAESKPKRDMKMHMDK